MRPRTHAGSPVAVEGRPRRRRIDTGHGIAYLILGLWVAFSAAAIGWIILASLSTSREIFTTQLLASGLHIENYAQAFTTHNLALYLLNSLIYIVPSLALIIAISAPAAYVLSRYVFRGRAVVEGALVSGIGVPGIVLVVPLFGLFIRLGLSGTAQGLILVYVGTSIPFAIFLLTAFMSSLPRELDEAARIDGCTSAGAFWRVMLPMARPGIVTVSIFTFIGLWNDYIFALIFVNSPERRTIAIGLEAVVQSMRYTGDWGGLFASVVIVFLPTMIVYLILSERIIAGVTAGAVKG